MLAKQRDHVATGASEPLRAGETTAVKKLQSFALGPWEPAVGLTVGQKQLHAGAVGYESLSATGQMLAKSPAYKIRLMH